jgi:hypothetical protein
LSPAPDAWSRPDIPLHYLAMLKNTRQGAAFVPEEDGKRGPMQFIEDLKKKGHLVAYAGDVVGTGSSRKSATNSVVWATMLVSLLFIPVLYLCFKRAVDWIIYINVCSWTWTHCFYFFIYISFVTTIKCSMDCFLCNNFILYIIFFFLVIILTWSWIFCISLSCKRSFNFVFPEFTSSCF